MDTNKDNSLDIVENENEVVEEATDFVEETPAQEEVVAAVPAVKTKKEIKKERKEIKKHKKEVKREAMKHSAKNTKLQQFVLVTITLAVIASMLACSFLAIKTVQNLKDTAVAARDGSAEQNKQENNDSQQNIVPENDNNVSDDTENKNDTPADNSGETPADDSGKDETANSGDEKKDEATTPLGSKAEVVEYYKKAHAKVLAEAKTATKVYDNTVNYNDYLEVGGNKSLASVAKTLMGTFMKEVTDPQPFSGADIATNFPSSNNSSAGLTADMIGDYSVKEEGDNYIITLSINSSEEKPDLGDNSAHLVTIVKSEDVSNAAAGFVEFTGLENRYIAPTVTATINKTTGQMTALETDTPSYMCFTSATVMKIITVNNVGIGLEYIQKWTIEW